jgi:hypothetical protein
MTQNDAELDKEKPAVRLLLPLVTEVWSSEASLRTFVNGFKLSANGLKVTQTIRRLMGELLALPDYRGIASDLGPSDVEPLLDLILYVRMHCSACLTLLLTPSSYSKLITCRNPAFQMPTRRRGN